MKKNIMRKYDFDGYEFYTGRCFDIYEYLGCHVEEEGAVFRTFAPAAVRISVIGEFNDWKETPMQKVYDGNFWECSIPEAKPGMLYKYRIEQKDGRSFDHCDPYGFGMELRPHNASVIRDMNQYKFHDNTWLRNRTNCKDKPLNIYEIHAGSWKKKGEAAEDWYTYRELADLLIPYLKEMGYNYIEMMPLGEHPCDESWGYQSTGFYSPTSRYGTCDDLKYFVDQCHMNNIGVILDFVPVHFAVDDYGLFNYDGTALYEYPYADVTRSEWGSMNFNHSRGEVRCFLQSNAQYWINEYHFDGLRMDAISNLIFWQGDASRGVNHNTVEFIRYMNQGLKELNKGIILAAEDSTVYPGITKPFEEGGFGFDYKWNMGWMHDTLKYFQEEPSMRSRDYHKITFSMQYYYSEDYILPLSHDEVVHGKATILQKMNGLYEGKFPQGRTLYLYMFTHPGKKLNFMGNEFGQLREWDEKREQDWGMLEYPNHRNFARFIRDLNQVYLNHSELWKLDYEREGFRWLDCHQESRCIYAFERSDGRQKMIVILNLSWDIQPDYRIDKKLLENADHLELILNTDWDIYGGAASSTQKLVQAENGNDFRFHLAPCSGQLYRIMEK